MREAIVWDLHDPEADVCPELYEFNAVVRDCCTVAIDLDVRLRRDPVRHPTGKIPILLGRIQTTLVRSTVLIWRSARITRSASSTLM
jgi:hypothetical protein